MLDDIRLTVEQRSVGSGRLGSGRLTALPNRYMKAYNHSLLSPASLKLATIGPPPLNAVEIEQAVSDLVEACFDREAFAFSFLEAFGNKATTIKKLKVDRAKKGSSNKSDLELGQVFGGRENGGREKKEYVLGKQLLRSETSIGAAVQEAIGD